MTEHGAGKLGQDIAASLWSAMRVQWTRCCGPMFSPTEERPKKPVPMVMELGARSVSKPAAPWLQGALTTTR